MIPCAQRTTRTTTSWSCASTRLVRRRRHGSSDGDPGGGRVQVYERFRTVDRSLHLMLAAPMFSRLFGDMVSIYTDSEDTSDDAVLD